ncbi:MAG: NADH-quinone oxidoreductase subunit D [Deltaproteobacteria bacterium]|nr:NADH-quinone oxidoreductase subunit D [Deltaproteobacteria bacterium]
MSEDASEEKVELQSARRGRVDPHLSIKHYDPEADMMLLHFGPQHPSTHGVFRMDLHLDGEVVIKATPYLGFLHRAVEKLCEKLTYVQQTPIVDKNDYVAPMTNEQALNMAFEKIMNVEVPRRAKWLRVLLAELQRIASHLVALGTFTLDLGGALGGGSTLFLHCFREREMVLDLFEELTGARFHYNTHTIGGNRHDLPPGFDKKVRAVLDEIELRIPDYARMSVDNAIFRARTEGVGILDGELALELGITGPNLRGSGVDHDLRRDAPYAAYDELVPKVIVERGGDCWARTKVRFDEVAESIRLCRLALDGMPEGPINGYKAVRQPTQAKVAGGQVYVGIETPRGELGTFLIGGGDTPTAPYRLKIRSPSLHALSAIPYILPGFTVSDAVAILGSLDPIMGEVDR